MEHSEQQNKKDKANVSRPADKDWPGGNCFNKIVFGMQMFGHKQGNTIIRIPKTTSRFLKRAFSDSAVLLKSNEFESKSILSLRLLALKKNRENTRTEGIGNTKCSFNAFVTIDSC
jgi:hypothetical protein